MSIVDQLRELGVVARTEIGAAQTLEELRELHTKYLGRKQSPINDVLKGIRDLSEEDKRVVGPAGNELKRELSELIESRETSMAREAEELLLATDRVDLTLPGRTPLRGAPNPLQLVISHLEDVFVGMGYEVAEGPEVDTEWHNFDALNIPSHHPARHGMDTLFVRNGEGEPAAVLRTHTSSVQARVMTARTPPIYVVCPGRTFRNDTPDSTHTPVFHQIEGLAVDEGLSMADLRGTLLTFARAAFGRDLEIKLSPYFFPFTEPSAELAVSCHLCEGKGCSQCAAGWLEIGGAGMVDPNVLTACGIDAERYTGFAFGMGIERIAMLRWGVRDIRQFFEGDQRFLAQFRGVPA